MKFDWKHWALFFGAPMVEAFFEYEEHAASPLSGATLAHALLAMLVVGVALAQKSFLPPKDSQ